MSGIFTPERAASVGILALLVRSSLRSDHPRFLHGYMASDGLRTPNGPQSTADPTSLSTRCGAVHSNAGSCGGWVERPHIFDLGASTGTAEKQALWYRRQLGHLVLPFPKGTDHGKVKALARHDFIEVGTRNIHEGEVPER